MFATPESDKQAVDAVVRILETHRYPMRFEEIDIMLNVGGGEIPTAAILWRLIGDGIANIDSDNKVTFKRKD